MRLIILINYRNVYCWYKMFYNYFKILFPPFMKKKAFVMVTVWCSGQINTRLSSGSSGLCGSRKDKSFWKQTGITHFTSRASIHSDHIPQSGFSQHTHTPNHKNAKPAGWSAASVLDDDRVTDRNRSWHLLLCDVWHRICFFCKEKRKKETMVTLCPYDIYRDPKVWDHFLYLKHGKK